jgi:hypothetical protein
MTPDPVLDKLARFTPDGSPVDPAAILFRAGRASARTHWGWKVAVAGLLLANLGTVGFFALRPEKPHQPPEPMPVPVAVPVVVPSPEPQPSPEVSPSPWSLGALLRTADPRDLPVAQTAIDLAPTEPPLTPRSVGRADID